MKRIRLPKSFTLNGVFIYMALFFITTFALLEHTSVSIPMFSFVKLPLMYAGFFCLVTQMKTISRCILRKTTFYTLLAVLLFCFLLVVSFFASSGSIMGMAPKAHTLRLILFLMELFLLMIVLAETGRTQSALNFLFWYILIVVIINDVLIFSRVLTVGRARHESFIVGTKFSVAYLHMNLLIMWVICRYQKAKKTKFFRMKVLLAGAGLVLVSIRVDCMTGLVGCFALVWLITMQNKPKKRKLMMRLISPNVLLLAIVISIVFVFVAESIMEIPAVQYVVEDLLHRNSRLTGRTTIYRKYIENMHTQWLFGYGYGNGNEAAEAIVGAANVQNGVLDWMFQVGVLATGGMILLLLQVFRQAKRCSYEKKLRMMPLVVLIYVYVILGAVETTYNMTFFMWFALMFMIINDRVPIGAAEQTVQAGQTA